jgi:ATP-binding cassette subfamily B protein
MFNFLKDTFLAKKSLFLSATAITIFLKGIAVIPALLLGKIIDSLVSSGVVPASGVLWLFAALCMAIIFQSVFSPLQTYQLVSLVQTTLKEKSTEWTKAILEKEFNAFSVFRLGGLIKSVERGITAHEKLLTFFITSGFPLFIELILVGAVFAYAGGFTLFMALLGISIGYMLLYRYVVNWRRPYLLIVNAEEDLVSSRLFETLHAGKIIKLEQACDSAPRPLYESYAAYARAATKVASTGAVLGSIRILYTGLSTTGLLAWGVQDQLSASPNLTVGALVAVFSIAGMFLNNFSQLAESYRTLDQFLVDKKRLQEILLLESHLHIVQTLLSDRLLSLSLSVMSPLTDRPMRFYREQSVAIIGSSGAGKTTLLETLAGVVKTRRHHLGFNDRQLQPQDIEGYLRRVRYCPQGPVFLEGAFEHSVLFGREKSSVLAQAVDDLELRELVENRLISEGAKNISGGEAKRLSLLRLINRPGDFNLFDEPTASLDQDTRLRVWEVIFCHFKNSGLICVTHDLEALPRFERVIVMAQGAVVADGPWSELEDEGRIAELVAQIVSGSDDP